MARSSGLRAFGVCCSAALALHSVLPPRTPGAGGEVRRCASPARICDLSLPYLHRRYGRGRGALGLRMRDLLPPGLRWVLVSKYMIDIEWQLDAAPALLRDGLRVVIVHGDRHAEKCCPCPLCYSSFCTRPYVLPGT